jgi:hypothetical protein
MLLLLLLGTVKEDHREVLKRSSLRFLQYSKRWLATFGLMATHSKHISSVTQYTGTFPFQNTPFTQFYQGDVLTHSQIMIIGGALQKTIHHLGTFSFDIFVYLTLAITYAKFLSRKV